MNQASSFLTEYMAENFRGGRDVKPDPENTVSREKRDIRRKLKETADRTGKTVADVSMDFVNSNFADIQRYVTVQGETPLQNPAELATQAFLLRQKEIDKVASTMGLPYEHAEIFLEDAESKAKDINHPDADNFLGGLLAGVGPVAQKGLGKLADQHAKAHGGKRGVAGFLADILGTGDPKEDAKDATDTKKEDKATAAYSAKVLAQEVIDKVTDNKKKQVINQNLPLIIGGIIVLILVTILITRHAAKS